MKKLLLQFCAENAESSIMVSAQHLATGKKKKKNRTKRFCSFSKITKAVFQHFSNTAFSRNYPCLRNGAHLLVSSAKEWNSFVGFCLGAETRNVPFKNKAQAGYSLLIPLQPFIYKT